MWQDFYAVYARSPVVAGGRYTPEEIRDLETCDYVHMLVAYAGDVPVGIALAVEMAVVWAYLDVFFVLPEARGRGIGTRLLDRLRRTLPDGRRLETAASVAPDATTAVWLEGHGFRRAGDIVGWFVHDGDTR